MKVNKGKFFILLASIFTGLLIVNTFDFSGVTKNIFSLNAVDYKKAVEERNQLYKDIDSIKSENIDYRYKISKYDEADPKKSEKLVEDMKSQLVDYGALSGITSIKGPGLIIKLQDGDRNKLLDTQYDVYRKMLHEDDMALVLNDLRNAGAQAVAMNDHRVLPNTAVSCYWAFIGFEDQSSIFAPFYIYAIGNAEEMKAALLAENSIIQKLLLRKIKVEIEVKDEIILPATKQNTEVKYMERYEVK
ncbi:MAG: DUF881 domain-containing protein [Clostridium sartagoforme]|nr:DUF881 domain-containing protein [Clostridium sartagoforme]